MDIERLKDARKKLQESIWILEKLFGDQIPFGFKDAMNSLNREIGKCIE